jgi:putative glutathione S-transferase
MGYLDNGVWVEGNPKPPASNDGSFVRATTGFRNWITADGSSSFPAVPGRYHLYVSLACPWACRTLMTRALRGLEEAISLSVVDPFMGDHGWVFSDGPDCIPDTVNGFTHLHQVYTAADPVYTGRVSVPVIWDKERRTIVSNESSEIIIMLLQFPSESQTDLYPEHLRAEIDEINQSVYENINNGVYKCGFATSQAAYDAAFDSLFSALDTIEARLAEKRYLVGSSFTLADIRLFVTLIRFDAVYVTLFKTNRAFLSSFHNISGYLREIYQMPRVAGTVHFDHIKRHYFSSLSHINPTRIVAKGPVLDFTGPHGRDSLE